MASVKITPVRARSRGRNALERLVMLAPDVFAHLGRPVLALPPLLRRPFLRAVTEMSFAAINRGDLDLLARLFFHPEVVLNFDEDPGPDFRRQYVGRTASFAAYRQWTSEWGVLDRVPVGFVDRGDRLIVLARERMRGEGSGLEFERELGQVFVLRGGRIALHWEYRTWEAALAH